MCEGSEEWNQLQKERAADRALVEKWNSNRPLQLRFQVAGIAHSLHEIDSSSALASWKCPTCGYANPQSVSSSFP